MCTICFHKHTDPDWKEISFPTFFEVRDLDRNQITPHHLMLVMSSYDSILNKQCNKYIGFGRWIEKFRVLISLVLRQRFQYTDIDMRKVILEILEYFDFKIDFYFIIRVIKHDISSKILYFEKYKFQENR